MVFEESQVVDIEALHHVLVSDTTYNKLQVAHGLHDHVSAENKKITSKAEN